jgi:hypothetical protein
MSLFPRTREEMTATLERKTQKMSRSNGHGDINGNGHYVKKKSLKRGKEQNGRQEQRTVTQTLGRDYGSKGTRNGMGLVKSPTELWLV